MAQVAIDDTVPDDPENPEAGIPQAELTRIGVGPGQTVRVRSRKGDGYAEVDVVDLDDRHPKRRKEKRQALVEIAQNPPSNQAELRIAVQTLAQAILALERL